MVSAKWATVGYET